MQLDWEAIAAELRAGQWEDERLGRRAELIAKRLGANPELSFPKALPSEAELEGAYRFFSNPAVCPNDILDGHYAATRQRCQQDSSVLVLHDSSKFRFREDGVRGGLGRLVKSGQTFFGHVGLVIADDDSRRPLGIANLQTWVRAAGEVAAGSEHARWARGVNIVSERLVGARLIHVMDREGDDYGLLSHLVMGGHRFVIRSLHNRWLEGLGQKRRKLHDVLATLEYVVERSAKLSKRKAGKRSVNQLKIHPPRKPRTAQLAIGATSITLSRPRRTAGDEALLAASIRVNVVRVWEPQPPVGEVAVEWVLLTSESITTTDDVLRVVQRHRARWTVEEYFKCLKTGCAYETRQLGDYESLINALAVFAPIACQLLHMRSQANSCPDAPAETVVTADELQVLRVLGRKPLPETPSAKEVLLAIAAMGGHIKYGGPPGWLTLARGYTELLTLTKGWIAAKLQLASDQR